MTSIQGLWDDDRLPIISGLYFGDGTLREISVEGLEDRSRSPTIRLGTRRALTKLLEGGEPDASTLGELCRALDEPGTLRVSGGEGSSGGDGFLGLVEASTGNLRRALFLKFSNPFVEVAFVGDEVHAVTTFDDYWILPVSSPERLLVKHGREKGWDRRTRRLPS